MSPSRSIHISIVYLSIFFGLIRVANSVPTGYNLEENTLKWTSDDGKLDLNEDLRQRRLNVHIVPHSHDDSGWLKTFEQYYWGSRQDIQAAGVRYILDSVVAGLLADPERKFTFAEMSFFSRWWSHQQEDTKRIVRQLVQEGRLNFVNGGYVQHDEACAHFVGMIDQTTRGHRFLLREFNITPNIGWQIDPFGHSSTQAGLLGTSLGFDAVFFGRADYQDMERRKRAKELEMLWYGSGHGKTDSIFTGNFASGNYGPPKGFWWEWSNSPDAPMIEDGPERNIEERVETFVQRCFELANMTVGDDIMLTMGSDFHYAAAHVWFSNLDILIKHVNMDGRIHVFYSSPEDYVAAKHRYSIGWPEKHDDFFPYSDSPHAYWTGYFSSRSTSKGMMRRLTSYLQGARQLEAFINNSHCPCHHGGASTDLLEEAVSLVQHHDAITGTAKQHVVNDYHRLLHHGMIVAQNIISQAIKSLLIGHRIKLKNNSSMTGAENHMHLEVEFCILMNISSCMPSVASTKSSENISLLVTAYNSLAWMRQSPIRIPVSTKSTCIYEVIGPHGENIPFNLVPSSSSTAHLQSLMASIHATDIDDAGDAEIVFIGKLPPLGYSTFEIRPMHYSRHPENHNSIYCTKIKESNRFITRKLAELEELSALTGLHGIAWNNAYVQQLKRGRQKMVQEQGDDRTNSEGYISNTAPQSGGKSAYELTNGILSLLFDKDTGQLRSMENKRSGTSIPLAMSYVWFNASDGLDSDEDKNQASGAYIFRPNGHYRIEPQYGHVHLEINNGNEVSEARQIFNDWASVIIRLYKGDEHVEFEWTVGPIPFEDGLGKEVALRYSTGLNSSTIFWTDSNGRAMMKRKKDNRPTWKLNVTEPIAGNYYPVTSAAYIQDMESKLKFVVLTDRAQGATSSSSGELEFMVHRRILCDDHKGVGEPLNETMCGCRDCDCPGLVARGVHWISFVSETNLSHRKLQQLLNDPPILLFTRLRNNGDFSISQTLQKTHSFTNGYQVPYQSQVVTLMRPKDAPGTLLVRLSHLYEKRELVNLGDKNLKDGKTTINLSKIVENYGCPTVESFAVPRELSLSANQDHEVMEHRRKAFIPYSNETTNGDQYLSSFKSSIQEQTNPWMIDLYPMEIRTFEITC